MKNRPVIARLLRIFLVLSLLVLFMFFDSAFISSVSNENTIAYGMPLLSALSLPLIFFLGIVGWISIGKFENKDNLIIAKASYAKLEENIRTTKCMTALACIISILVCSVCLFVGISTRNVITDDYKIKHYSPIYSEGKEYILDNIYFVKIYPEAFYARFGGFESIYTVIELYINENDCFYFTSDEFKSFEDMIKLKEAIEKTDAKIYISDRAANDPDPDFLTEEEMLAVESFYEEYEKIK